MFLTYLMLFVALMLSAVAAFYSIVGLTAIFAAAVIPIVIMGTILEAAKLVVTVWLHEYWRDVKLTMKLYLVPAVVMLMVITSMGIFGFLSKAHTDQALVSGDASARLSIVDEKIRIERENIANARAVIQQMDAAVTGVIATGDQEIKLRDGSTQIRSAAERSLQIRRSQARDRAALTQQIEEAQTRIVRLQEESAPLRAEFRKVEAEVGPIKYIAALIYGDNPDANLLEKAVRWVIIILVIVFDPLAIMMLLAATESYRWERERRAALASVTPDSGPDPEPKPETEPDPQPAPLAEPEPEPAPEPPALGPKPDSEVEYQILDDVSEPDYPEPASPEPVQATNADHDTDDDSEDEPSVVRQCKRLWKQDNPGNTLKEQRRLVAAGQLDHEPWLDYLDDPRLSREVGFGEILPTRAFKGDMFVMTSVAPTALFKFNGEKWITIDKEFTDQYAHNDAYISYLIEQIGRGAYDPDLLSEAERAQIAQRLQQEI